MTTSASISPAAPGMGPALSSVAVESLDAAVDRVISVRLSGLPDEEGLLHVRKLRLPGWTRCCYYAPFQRHAINPSLDLWPEGYNQCHPLPLCSDTELGRAKRGGMFAIFELDDGSFLALLPLVGARSVAWLRGDGEGSLEIAASHFGAPTTAFEGDLPLLAVASGATPYAASAAAWRLALSHPTMRGLGKLRSEKTYPEVFEYLGWCSFEEYKLDINERIIVDALRALAVSPVPVRWALIDDGHIDDCSSDTDPLLETQEGAFESSAQKNNLGAQARFLHSAEPHAGKFPNGWSVIRRTADADPRLRWLGLWLNFNGYWGGIAPNHRLGAGVDRHLVSLDADDVDSPKLPGEKPGDADVFYRAFAQPVHEAGFDFIKVDNQAANLRKYTDASTIENAVAAAVGCRHALEKVVDEHFEGIIGCMAHNNLCLLHQPVSQIVRCSEDYKKEDIWRAKHHLHNSFGNMLWMGHTVWGDHDMFHSSDRVAGALMARSKAISGGPVYLSDHPDNFVRELIAPLHLSDGRVLRPLAPAVPTPESVFINPYEDDDAYRVIAPLPHGCAALAAYNLTHPEKTVRGAWRRDDLRHRTAMLAKDDVACDGEQTPDSAVLLYDTLAGTARLLETHEDVVKFELSPLSDAFVILSPVVCGWALVGNPEKYLPPVFITRFEISEDARSATVSGAEAGPVLVWHAQTGLRRFELPAGRRALTINL